MKRTVCLLPKTRQRVQLVTLATLATLAWPCHDKQGIDVSLICLSFVNFVDVYSKFKKKKLAIIESGINIYQIKNQTFESEVDHPRAFTATFGLYFPSLIMPMAVQTSCVKCSANSSLSASYTGCGPAGLWHGSHLIHGQRSSFDPASSCSLSALCQSCTEAAGGPSASWHSSHTIT